MAKILIVEWEEEERLNVWSILEREGHEIFFAHDGKTALDVWQKKGAEVVIAELYIPELNGLRLIKKLVERDPGVRIIAVSEISADQLHLAQDYGACAVLSKPFTPEDLREAMSTALEGYRPGKSDSWR